MKFHQVDHWLIPRKNGISKIEVRKEIVSFVKIET